MIHENVKSFIGDIVHPSPIVQTIPAFNSLLMLNLCINAKSAVDIASNLIDIILDVQKIKHEKSVTSHHDNQVQKPMCTGY
jgi:hypothetical protein